MTNQVLLPYCNTCHEFHTPDKCPMAGGASTPFVAVINDMDETISDDVAYDSAPVADWKRKYDGNTQWTSR